MARSRSWMASVQPPWRGQPLGRLAVLGGGHPPLAEQPVRRRRVRARGLAELPHDQRDHPADDQYDHDGGDDAAGRAAARGRVHEIADELREAPVRLVQQ